MNYADCNTRDTWSMEKWRKEHIARQQTQIETLTATVQKVSDEMEATVPTEFVMSHDEIN